jgi:hypothetical protein
MHQLVQEVARTVAGQPTLPERYEATVGLLLAALARDDVRPSPDVLTPHVAAAVRASDQASADPRVTSYLTRWLGNRHYAYGDLATAMSYLRQAADMASQPGLLREVLPAILHDLIRACRAAGEIDVALAAADEWADAARSAGSSLEECRASFSRRARADHLAALGSQGSALERDLGHEQAPWNVR